MHPIEEKAFALAEALLDRARDKQDVETATLLRRMGRVYAVAHEVATARTHEQSKAAYAELVDLMKNKSD